MNRFRGFAALFAAGLILAGCATAPKSEPPAGPDARDKEISALKNALEEQKVLTAEAEARAAKAENDRREVEMAKSAVSKPVQDPYLK